MACFTYTPDLTNKSVECLFAGVVVKCGMSGRLVTSIYIDNIPVKIAGGKADEDGGLKYNVSILCLLRNWRLHYTGLGTTDTRDEGSEQLVFNVQLDRSVRHVVFYSEHVNMERLM